MTGLFYSILKISITAGLVAVAVMFFRFLFKGAPRWISCLLWALVAFRLLCPVAVESELSLMPDLSEYQQSTSSSQELVPSGVPVTQAHVNTPQGTPNSNAQQKTAQVDAGRICAIVWLGGMGVMALYGGVSYLLTRLRVRESVPLESNIRQSDRIKSPFILGVLRPYIYIPFNLDKRTKKYVLAHEQAHLKRLDHIWKPLGFILLCVHWFNPLMWVSYVLLCRDIEVACDERVIRDYSLNKRKNYAHALLECKVSQNAVAVCPLAFGEVGVGERIKKTLKYKKPARIIAVVAVIMILSVSGCLLTDPVSSAQINYYTPGTRVTAGYEKPTEPPVTEPPTTAPPTEPPATEAPTEAEYYEEYYDYSDDYYYDYSDDYYSEDYYSDYYNSQEYMETLFQAVEPLTINPEDYIIDWGVSSNYSFTNNSFSSGNSNYYGGVDPFEPIVWDHHAYNGINNTYQNSPFGNRSSGVTSAWKIP